MYNFKNFSKSGRGLKRLTFGSEWRLAGAGMAAQRALICLSRDSGEAGENPKRKKVGGKERKGGSRGKDGRGKKGSSGGEGGRVAGGKGVALEVRMAGEGRVAVEVRVTGSELGGSGCEHGRGGPRHYGWQSR
jgi:hypothetical protein